MFTTDSPVNYRFYTWAAPIMRDVRQCRKAQWLEDDALLTPRMGTLRCFINLDAKNLAELIIRVGIDRDTEHEVPLVELMNATLRGVYTTW